MKNNQNRIKYSYYIVAVVIAGCAGLYYLVTLPFERPSGYGFKQPREAFWYGDGAFKDSGRYAAYITKYAANFDDMSAFPFTHDGVLNLKAFITMLWILRPPSDETWGDIELSKSSPLYKKISLFFPNIGDNTRESNASVSKIFLKINDQQPSRFRFFLFRMGFLRN